MAHHIISKALQECPTSGAVWAAAISLEPKARQVCLLLYVVVAAAVAAVVVLAVVVLVGVWLWFRFP